MFHLNGKRLSGLMVMVVGTIASLVIPSAIGSNRIGGNGLVMAHQVEIAGDVGGTIHIEPNDTPRAGQEVLAWFALTKRGGQVIPLAHCDCSLAMYNQPYREGNAAIATPSLRSISAEGYNGIPGADVVFPRPGSYELILTGEPRTPGTFSPFELTFSVTVAR
jgi:hypothetical protein